jgi:Spx/MgsR family transcriptional regulator
MIKLYGLNSCDTCRKAIRDLKKKNFDYEFFDIKKDSIDLVELKSWLVLVGSDALLNKRGTTWRGLSYNEKTDLNDQKILSLMIKYPALIKRPVFKVGNKLIIGYKEEQKEVLGLLGLNWREI